MVELNPGDIVSRPKGLFTHKGAYLGAGQVLHALPGIGTHISSLEEFASGQPVSVQNLSAEERAAVLSRVETELRTSRSYDALRNNCQNVVNRLRTGISYSEEVIFGGLLFIAALAFTLLKVR